MNTHRGLFQYHRLYIKTLLQSCHGVSVYLDDILIIGSTIEEHLQNLDHVLQILETAGLIKDKCKFLLPKVTAIGMYCNDVT